MNGAIAKTAEQLAREDVERQALEAAAKHLETQGGNAIYMQAWKKAARLVRELKPN